MAGIPDASFARECLRRRRRPPRRRDCDKLHLGDLVGVQLRQPEVAVRTDLDVEGIAALGVAYSVMDPDGVMLAILSAKFSVNQRLPSVPVVMLIASLFGVGMSNSVIVPAGVILPILFPTSSVISPGRYVGADAD